MGSLTQTTPQIQNVLNKSVLLDTPSKNLFDKDRSIDGYYLLNTNGIVSSSGFGYSDYIAVVTGSTYTITDGARPTAARFTCFYDANKSYVAGGSSVGVSSITIPSGVSYVRFTYQIGVYTSVYTGKDTVQFELGAATYYAPYSNKLSPSLSIPSDNLQKVVSNSINLFDKLKASDNKYIDNAGNITLNSIYGTFGTSDYIPVVAGLTYSASDHVAEAFGLVAAINIMRTTCFFDANKNIVAGGNSNSSYSVLIPAGVAFIRFSYNYKTINSATCGKNSIQFELGALATKYKPYQMQLVTDGTFSKISCDAEHWGFSRLRRLKAWKNNPDYLYSMAAIGDSYTAGGYFYPKLKTLLTNSGMVDSGVGWCSFAFGDGLLASNSLDKTKLKAEWITGDWLTNATASWGIDATDTVSQGTNKTIVITAGQAFTSIQVVYQLSVSGAGFTYKINAGSETTVSTSGTSAVSSVTIDTSTAGTSFTVTIKALGSGVSLSGCLGAPDNAIGLQIHKCGLTGGRAINFARTTQFQQSAALLNPKCVMIMFGTNEISNNTPPSLMKGYIQNIVNYFRAIDPMCDLIFAGPQQQQYGTEQVKAYVTADYADVMFQLANENDGAAYISFEKIFGTFGQHLIDAGYMATDRVHPNPNRGGYLMATTVYNRLVG